MSESQDVTLPSQKILTHATKMAINDDKPILLDYWVDSFNSTVFIGVRENDEKMLVRDEEQYTSPISKIFKVGEEFLILTENSIYIVSTKIQTRKIS
jgi:hypothetical protein